VVTQISITPIPVDRPPFPFAFGAEFPMYFTVQPGGAYIEPYGARIIYPNITNEPPGTRINFWNYDPEEKDWHIYGRGTVTPDGRQVVPDEGVVIYRFAGASFKPFGTGPCPADCDEDGDPVDLGTGLFVLRKTDLLLPDVIPIGVTRTHRQGFAQQGIRPFGIGSAHSYELFLFRDVQLQEIDLILPDGARVHYPRISPGTGEANAVFEHATTPSLFFKSRIRRANNRWELTLRNGTTYTFADAVVPTLQFIEDRYGNSISIARGVAAHGKVTRVISPHGRWLEFTLDIDDILGNVTQVKDNTGRVVSYGYDESGRLSNVTDPLGGVTEYTYDSSNRVRTIKDARGIAYVTNEYDDGGRVIKQIRSDGSTFEFEYTVDANGKITQAIVTDPRGNIRRVTFNADGYMLTDTRAPGTPEEQTTIYEREAGTNLVLSISDPLGRKTAKTYDAMGNVIAITQLADTPEAVTTRFTYEPEFNQLASVTDPLGHTNAFAYDDKGDVRTVTDARGNSMLLAYNSEGQPVSITDALGNTAQLTYDLGIRSGLINPLGATSTWHVDSAGQPTTLTNPLGSSTTYAYDALDRLVKVTGPMGGVTTFTYDFNGNVLSMTDARGSVTSFAYDDMDRLLNRTDALGRAESYEYDAAGNPTQFTDRRGMMTVFTHDALNRLTQVVYADDSTTTYRYDAGDRLTQVVDSVSGTIALTYDNLDRLTEVSTPQGTTTYTYDAAGRRASMLVQGQPAVAYKYDAANHLTEITQGAVAVTIDYDAAGRPVSLTMPGDVVVEVGYDVASQLTGIIYKRAGNILGDLTYAYDAAGNRARVGGSFARTTIPEVISALTYDAANQLTQRETSSLRYDANGNLTSDGARNYVWDVRNQLASIGGHGIAASFEYDTLGRRIRKTVNGTTTEFLYDGLNIVQELSGGTPIVNLLNGQGIDECYVRTATNGSEVRLFDALGSTLGLLDTDGVLQTEYSYEPFGATTATGRTSANSLQYTGRENDATELYYYRARYYSPSLRRFISEDPLKIIGEEINFHGYAGNNPINFIDPLGLCRESGYWESVWRRFVETNQSIPIIGRVALNLAAAGPVSKRAGTYNWWSAARLPARLGSQLGGHIMPLSWRLWSALFTAVQSAVIVTVALEVGMFIGSMISEAYKRITDPCPCPGQK
jgi:RHS repeat-associated protein